MKRYSEYKDSGVKWIGEIPGHWECRKLKFLTSSMQSGDNLTAIQIKETGKYPVYGGNGIRGYYNESNCNRQCIVIGRQGALCGNVHIVKVPFWATDHAVVTYANENTDLDFLFYLTKAMNLNQYASQTAAQPGIAVSAIKNIYTCYPPLSEQEAIVTYLDSKVAKIDEYISIAEKKIAALEELKQTIIAEAVTRGIHKEVPMKDSEVNWIGMIPEHWKTISLKRVVSLINEKSNEQGIPYIGLENIEGYSGKILSLGETEPDGICNKFKKGDILFSKLRPYLTKCVSPSFDGKCTSELLVLRDFKGVANYLKYMLLSPKLVMDINASTYGAKMPRASWNYIGQCPIPIPPIDEQQEIVTYIETKATKIDQLCQAERSQIEKLKEYKQRLISDVVTGKVKVTND